MSGHQTATLEDTVYFWFASNDTSGSGGDGATPLYDVREAGALSSAIPLLSGTPTLLSHANYPAGCHEIAVDAFAVNGFAANDTFAVFCTIAVDSQNPSGFVGSCTLTPLSKASASSDIHSRLVVVEAAADSDQAQTEASIDSDQVQNDNFVSDIHSRLVVIEATIDSDQLLDVTAVSNVHSRLVVMETANDSDQVIISDAILVIDDLLDLEVPAITSNLVIIASDTVVIESDTTRLELALITATGALEGTPSATVLQTDLAELSDNHYNNMVFVMTSGDEAGEARRISAYTGSTGTVTLITPLSGAATAAETFAILNIPVYGDAITSNLVIVASDTLAIEADTNELQTDDYPTSIAALSTKQDSDQVIISDAILIIDTEMAAQTSNLLIIASDTLATEAGVVLATGTSDSGSTSTMVDAARTEGDTDYWVGNRILFTSGNIAGQVREITGFNFTTNTTTFAPVTTQAVIAQDYNIIQGVPTSNIHSRLVVMETANDSDQVIISDAILIIDTAIDSDQVQNDNFVSDIHSRLVVIEASIDSDQAQTEASIDSDQLLDATATSNIHSRLVVMETANDSDQVIISDAILVIDDLLDLEMAAQTSNLVIIASDTVVIESQTTVMNSGLVTGACEGTPTTTVIQTNLAEITDDHYIGRIIVFTSGNALGEASNITDYAGATGTVTVALMTTAPANTDTFTIY